jgi:hypothetical protein
VATTACGGSVAAGAAGQQSNDAGPEGGGGLGEGGTGTGDDGGTEAAMPDGGPFVAVQLYSCVPSTYTAGITVGSQSFQLTIDTGSTTLGVASTSCTNCSVNPEYTPGATAVDQHQQATSQYGTGSWSGEIFQDDVVAGTEAAVPVKLVAIDTQSQFFVPALCDSSGGSYQGILGLGPPGAALQGTAGYFDALVASQHVPDVFATQLCDTGGTLWLGGFDSSAMTAAPQYTPEISGIDSYYYAVHFTSISIGGTSTPVGTSQYPDSLVDTGTSVFIVPTSVFNAITSAVAASPNAASVFGGAGATSTFFASPNNCQTLSKTKAQLDAALPPLTLVFGSNPSISVQAAPTESYLISYQGQWCPAIYAMDPSANFPVASIMGSPVLRSNVVVFDRANKQIGFAPHKPCK